MPAGGTFSGPGVTSNVFSPDVAQVGTHTITYRYEDGNGCINSCTFPLTVNPLPVVSCGNDTALCIDESAFMLYQGSPAGGIYSGTGVTQAGYFDPSLSGDGAFTITYTYTDLNGCTDSCDFQVTVYPLPQMTCPDDTGVCISDDPFALGGGLPLGGTYSGNGVSNGMFDPWHN